MQVLVVGRHLGRDVGDVLLVVAGDDGWVVSGCLYVSGCCVGSLW